MKNEYNNRARASRICPCLILTIAYRLKAYSLYFLKRYNEAIANFTMVIEFWQNPAYHFDYQVEENLATAYYWRGNANKKLGLTERAKADFQTTVDLYPENAFAKWAGEEITRLKEMDEIEAGAVLEGNNG